MHEYDTALKSILMRLPGSVLEELTGYAVTQWRNVELPDVGNPRVDLLGETAEGHLVHIELQSTNDPDMPVRMAEYGWAIYRKLRRFAEQIVLYVGELPLRMRRELAGGSLSVQYRLVDVKTLDAEPLLASERLEDNVIALLLSGGTQMNTVRRILDHIAHGDSERRGPALAELLVLAGLRRVAGVIGQEIKKMPILNDIMDHELFGPKIREGIEIGRREGREEGRAQEVRQVVLRLTEKRFGGLPQWARQKVEAMSVGELEDTVLRVLDVGSLEQLLP